MKKILRYFIVSAVIVFLLIGIGYITFAIIGKPFPAINSVGGEYECSYGIGYVAERWYPLLQVGDVYTGNTSRFSLNYITLIAGIVSVIVIQFIIDSIRKSLKKNRSI